MRISSSDFDAAIFDLDGVITHTAALHAAAWKAMFDDYLQARAERGGTDYTPFDIDSDYRRYVDGKPRYDGVASFLESRDIHLPYGDSGDPDGKETVCGLGNRKNSLFRERLQREGVEVFDDALALIRRLRAAGLRTAVVSSSKNCQAVLRAADIEALFDERVDGVTSEELDLEGKPAPDIFLEAAKRLGVSPKRAVLFEDAVAGVQAGRAGGFGCTIGVDRNGQAEALREAGAQVVSSRLTELAGDDGPLPSALDCLDVIAPAGQKIALFLDYDGTLTPIVERPEDAVLDEAVRTTLHRLAEHLLLAVVSGRDLADVRERVGVEAIFYAGSHGFDIAGPGSYRLQHEAGEASLPALDAAEKTLGEKLAGIDGAALERKRFALAVHYRRVAEGDVQKVRSVVEAVLAGQTRLRLGEGKKVLELRPDIDWDKGKAVDWILDALSPESDGARPIYIGDDTTDEDAFSALVGRGVGIAVLEKERPTAAGYRLRNPGEVHRFLNALCRQRGDSA